MSLLGNTSTSISSLSNLLCRDLQAALAQPYPSSSDTVETYDLEDKLPFASLSLSALVTSSEAIPGG